MDAQTSIPDDLLKFEDLAARERKIIKKRGRKRQVGFGKQRKLPKTKNTSRRRRKRSKTSNLNKKRRTIRKKRTTRRKKR